MYALAISTGDSAALVTAVGTIAVFLGSLHSRILSYVLRIQDSITEIKGRTKAIEDRTTAIEQAIRTVNERLDSYFQG